MDVDILNETKRKHVCCSLCGVWVLIKNAIKLGYKPGHCCSDCAKELKETGFC